MTLRFRRWLVAAAAVGMTTVESVTLSPLATASAEPQLSGISLTPCHIDMLAEQVLCGVREVFVDRERTALSIEQRRERLQAAVQSLPMGLRQVVVLTLEGLSHAEVADVVGITENNVAVRLTRARAALSRRLGAREDRR